MRPQFVKGPRRRFQWWWICVALVGFNLFTWVLKTVNEHTAPTPPAPAEAVAGGTAGTGVLAPPGDESEPAAASGAAIDPFWGGPPAPSWARRVFDLARDGAPLSKQRRATEAALRSQGLSERAVRQVMAHTVDGIALLEDDTDHRSALGGDAVLPAGRAWPRNPDTDDALTFLARIDLREVQARAPLPPDGTLLIFHDFDASELDPYAETRVEYVPAGAKLVPAAAPEGAWTDYDRAPVRAVAMPITGEIDHIVEGLSDAEGNRLFEVLQGLSWGRGDNQLLGASRDVQGPVLDEVPYWFKETASDATKARFSAAERAGDGWMLLAQLTGTSFPRGGDAIGFADGGNYSLLIQERDLAARRFDRVLGLIQSH